MVSPFSSARRMILSSMSVMLRTKVTARPLARSQRCTTSKATMERACPTWHRSYTVMPQTYMRTWPGSSGENASNARDSVL